MIRTSLVIAAALALSACASAPTYTRAASPTAAGYSETQIEADRYFVTYRSASNADVSLLEDYALLRAADVTLERGREWFWVDRRTIDTSNGRSSGPSLGVGIGGGSWGGRSGVGASVGVSVPLGSRSGGSARAATLEIRLGQGAKPDEPNAYDARSIAMNLRSRHGA